MSLVIGVYIAFFGDADPVLFLSVFRPGDSLKWQSWVINRLRETKNIVILKNTNRKICGGERNCFVKIK